jgi:hypothetical protein
VFELLVVAAMMSVTDPAGDVAGDGSLRAPTAAVYRNLTTLDLHNVSVTDDRRLTLTIELGSLANPFELPLGFSMPVIEVYLGNDEPGRRELLAGSGMRLPGGHTWRVALRLTGEEATVYRATDGDVEEATADVVVDGNTLIVQTPFERPTRPRIYAMTGLYDLFGSSPWRPLESSESPWAFSSEAQRFPVVDVLARDEAAQRQALQTGVLVARGSRNEVPGAFWLVLMALGLLLSLTGIAVRALARRDDREANERAPAEAETARAAVQAPTAVPSRESSVEPAERARIESFSWDSSALLTQPHDDDVTDRYAAGFAAEFAERSGEESKKGSTGTTGSNPEVWSRPVPLAIEPQDTADAATVPGSEAQGEPDPELLTGDEPGVPADGPQEPTSEEDEESSLAPEEEPATGRARKERKFEES